MLCQQIKNTTIAGLKRLVERNERTEMIQTYCLALALKADCSATDRALIKDLVNSRPDLNPITPSEPS